jgi:hypothetical protein
MGAWPMIVTRTFCCCARTGCGLLAGTGAVLAGLTAYLAVRLP